MSRGFADHVCLTAVFLNLHQGPINLLNQATPSRAINEHPGLARYGWLLWVSVANTFLTSLISTTDLIDKGLCGQ